MKPLQKQSAYILIALLSLLVDYRPGLAQQSLKPKNFAGVNASILWNTTGISAGISGERIIVSKRNTELSIKAVHEFRHGFGNLIYFSGSQNTRSAETSLLVDGYLFTGKKKSNSGFFISVGTGAIHSNWKLNTGSSINYLRPVAEFGLGFKFRLNDGMALQWRNDLRIISPQPEKGGAGTVTTTTLALGF
jgi:hypothetical protein